MTVYRINWHDNEAGHCIAWQATAKEAKAVKQAAEEDPDCHSPEITIVDLPNSKASMVRWLNANLNLDNG